ncbi:hypothetical protein XE97_25255, partial [Salmonella enterica subsp. enterica serovar Senftenberg]|nr:hypothetical protein [Salmonella enterica]EBM0725671.1 hypothetical protein [Salmonella enterica subsp. enterica serovar Senftenberg]EBE7371379.1 hypothetical protein [Salmonella enterica]EBP7964838.1 hypothetical protein [Salmonella enterica]EBT4363507.1 hypothetical protein [Salmonella enterica]
TSSFLKMAVRGLPYLRSLSFALIIIISLYTMRCHYSLFAGVLLSFRKIVILCSTGCMAE